MSKLTLSWWLRRYYPIQEQLLLCYRESEKNGWNDRAMYLSTNYDDTKPYNHRNILTNEVIIEFDEEDPIKNKDMADKVCKRLDSDEIEYSKWFSGNKSVHIHIMFNTGNASNIQMLKRAIMEYYTKNIGVPDMKLASDNHLIRAEHGVHEKTGKVKKLLKKTNNYPSINIIKQDIWNNYSSDMGEMIKRQLNTKIKSMTDHPGIRWILAAEKFREVNDGRERALFMLIHVLKRDYKDRKDELTKFLQDWYRYSGGNKLTSLQIKHKVDYQWEKDYKFGNNYINNLLKDLGKDELIA